LIIVLMVLGVVLTVGLATAARGITEVSVSTTQSESAKALALAELGIERKLAGLTDDPRSTVTTSDLKFDTYSVPYLVENGDVVTVSLNGQDINNYVTICWGNGNTKIDVSGYITWNIEVMSRNVYSPQSADGCDGNGVRFILSDVFTDPPDFMRIRILGNVDPVQIKIIGTNLPKQGTVISATGIVGETVQKINAKQLLPDAPAVFEGALFSGSSLP